MSQLSLSIDITHGKHGPKDDVPDTSVTVWRWGTCDCGKPSNPEMVVTLRFPHVPFEMSANAPNIPAQLVRGISELAGILNHDVLEGKCRFTMYEPRRLGGKMRMTAM